MREPGKALDNAASDWYYIGIAFAIGHTPVQHRCAVD